MHRINKKFKNTIAHGTTFYDISISTTDEKTMLELKLKKKIQNHFNETKDTISDKQQQQNIQQSLDRIDFPTMFQHSVTLTFTILHFPML